MYNFSLRSLEEPGNVDEEENAGPRQAERESVQVSMSQRGFSCWSFVQQMLSVTHTGLKLQGTQSKPIPLVRLETALCSGNYRTLKRALSLAGSSLNFA